VFKDSEFRATREYVIGGLIVGAVIVWGWVRQRGTSGHLAE
jgi:hypothetical protein